MAEVPTKDRGVLIPLALAVAAAVVYMWTLTTREQQLVGTLEPIKVLLAATDLPERTRLNESLVRTALVPRRFAAPDAFEVRTPADMRMVTNLVTRVRIPKGGAITESALTSFSTGSGLAVKVPPGYRASVLPVERDMAALMKPGDRVDIVVTFEAVFAQGGRRKVTATILQNVLVLSVGRDLGAGQTGKGDDELKKAASLEEKEAISVAVNPIEFQYLELASDAGHLGVSLRAPGDIEIHPIKMADFATLFGG